jgi:hypothetical protein
MATWRELHRFKRSIDKHKPLVVKFKKVWAHGCLFCKDISTLLWQIVPNRFFFPKHMVDYRMGLFICPEVQMHNNQDIGSNSNSHGVEEIGHKNPTSENYQPSLGGIRKKKSYGRLYFASNF